MPYVVRRPRERFELRESVATPAGPRARTLASFSRLDAAVLASASARAITAWDEDAIVRSARRAGADVHLDPADRAARGLLAALASGSPLAPTLRRRILDALGGARITDDEALRSLTMLPQERGQVLRALCALADAFPQRPPAPLTFPPLHDVLAR